MMRSQRNIEISSANCLCQIFVLALRVNHYYVRVKHQRTQNFQFCRVRFSSAGFGKNDGIIIFHAKPIEKHERVIVRVYSVKGAFIRSKVKRNKWKNAGSWSGI